MLPGSQTEIPRKTIYRLFFIALVVELALFSYNIYEEYKYEPQIFGDTHVAYLSGDAHSYYEPIESLIQTGTYKSDSYDAGHSYYGRTPHYGLFYGFFRLFFDQNTALDAVILFQLLIRVLACIAFYRLVLLITKIRTVAAIAFGVFICMAPASLHAYRLMTESLSMSFFILSLSWMMQWKYTGKIKYLWLSGIFAGYMICMRPFLLPAMGILIFLNLFGKEFTTDLKRKVKLGVIYFIPLVVFIAPWVIRNYTISGKIIVFQENVNAGYDYTAADLSLRDLLTATGENFMSWDYDAAGCWFDPLLSAYYKYDFPQSMLCESISKEQLVVSRDFYRDGMLNRDTVSMLKADSMFREMRAGYISEKPFGYYVISPLRIMKRAFIHNGVELLKREEWYELLYKTLQAALFIAVCIGFVICVFIKDYRLNGYFWTIPVLLAIVLCIGFRFSERRYFQYCYPVFILYASYLYYQLLQKVRGLKQ